MRYSKEELKKAKELGTWPPPAYQCTSCKTVLQSQYPGEFVRCECGDSFVDQTPHYARWGGKLKRYESKKKD